MRGVRRRLFVYEITISRRSAPSRFFMGFDFNLWLSWTGASEGATPRDTFPI